MSVANRVIKNTIWLYVKVGVQLFTTLLATRIVLNTLGASDFGIFNIVGGAIAMLGFLNTSMAVATQRFMSYSEGEGNAERQKEIFNVSLLMHLSIAAIIILALIILSFVFFNGILSIPLGRENAAYFVYASLIVSTVFTIISVPYDAVINAHEDMRFYALVGISQAVLKLLVAFACFYVTYDKLITYGILMACIPGVILVIMLSYCHKKYDECIINIRKYFNKEVLREMTNFAGWNFLGISSSMIGNYSQNIILNHFFGVLVNAAMGIIVQLCGQLMVLTTNMMKAVNPVITKLAGSKNEKEMLHWSFTSCRFSYLLLAWIAIPFCFESNYLLRIWLKNVPEWTVIFIRLQLIRTLLEQLSLGMNTALNAQNRIKKLNIQSAYLFFIAIIVICLLFYLGYPPYMLFIVMIALVIVQTLLKLQLCHKYIGMGYISYLRDVFLPSAFLTMAMVMVGVVSSCYMEEGLVRTVITFISTWIVMLLVFVSCFMKKDEKLMLSRLIRKK